MEISVEHRDSKQEVVTLNESLSFLAFIKHLAFPALGGNVDDYQLRRFLRYFVESQGFFSKTENAFELPSTIEHDPNEKSYMTQKLGETVAHFLAKKIAKAKFSFTYDVALTKKSDEIPSSHPEFYCFNNNTQTQFSIKAKGINRKSISAREMDKLTAPAKDDELLNCATTASVTYNLYNNVHAKFYEPSDLGENYLDDLNNQLIEDYYNNIRFICESFNQVDLIFSDLPDEIKNNYVAYKVVDLYRYELASQNDFQRVRHYWKLYSDILELHILVHKNIINYSNQLDLGYTDVYDSEDCFIDLDGIGLCRLNT